MKTQTLTIRGINVLNQITKSLKESKLLTTIEKEVLIDFLDQLPLTNKLLEYLEPDELFEIKLIDVLQMDAVMQKWINLFDSLPGFDWAPSAYLVDRDNPKLLDKDVLILVTFAPSLTYNEQDKAFELYLNQNGTAQFVLKTVEEMEQFPEFYSFRGNWKDAYLLVIETLKKGWPQDEFPDELKRFLFEKQ